MDDFDLESIKKGGTEAFKPLFDKYFLILKRFVLKYIPENDLACDIAQETLTKLWFRRKKMKNMAAARSFMFVTARNAVIDEIRHRKALGKSREHLIAEAQEDTFFYEEEAVRAMYDDLREQISRLPERTGAIIRLSSGGYRNDEIADRLGIGRETVKTLKRKGIRKLNKSMSSQKEIWDTHISDFNA